MGEGTVVDWEREVKGPAPWQRQRTEFSGPVDEFCERCWHLVDEETGYCTDDTCPGSENAAEPNGE